MTVVNELRDFCVMTLGVNSKRRDLFAFEGKVGVIVVREEVENWPKVATR